MSEQKQYGRAIAACLGVVIVFSMIGGALGLEEGGGIFVIMILMAVLAGVWRHFTKGERRRPDVTVKPLESQNTPESNPIPIQTEDAPASVDMVDENKEKVECVRLEAESGTSYTGTLYKDHTPEEAAADIISKKAPDKEYSTKDSKITGTEVAVGAIGCWTIIMTLIGIITLIMFAMG